MSISAPVVQGINGSGEARTWLLPLVRQHTRGAQLGYWGSKLLPAARACGGLAAAAEQAGPGHQHQARVVWICWERGVITGTCGSECVSLSARASVRCIIDGCVLLWGRRCSVGRWSCSCGRRCLRSAPGQPTPVQRSRASDLSLLKMTSLLSSCNLYAAFARNCSPGDDDTQHVFFPQKDAVSITKPC